MHESLSALTKFSEATALRAKNSPEIGKTYSSNVVGFLAFAKVYSHSIDQFKIFLSSKYKQFLCLFRRGIAKYFKILKITFLMAPEGMSKYFGIKLYIYLCHLFLSP